MSTLDARCLVLLACLSLGDRCACQRHKQLKTPLDVVPILLILLRVSLMRASEGNKRSGRVLQCFDA